MRIVIETIPHGKQRYPTAGDWQWVYPAHRYEGLLVNGMRACYYCAGTRQENHFIGTGENGPCKKGPLELKISVSSMSDWRYEALIAVHELVEALACKHGDIPEADIDSFDMKYQGPYQEPGDDPQAPYRSEHQFATSIETRLMGELEVNPSLYEIAVTSLFKGKKDD